MALAVVSNERDGMRPLFFFQGLRANVDVDKRRANIDKDKGGISEGFEALDRKHGQRKPVHFPK